MKLFADDRIFKLYMSIDTKEKPYICEICNKAFSQSKHCKIHLRIHTKEKTMYYLKELFAYSYK
ncbi:UNVERIFIED_CONTAM: Neurotrophin receptor-interacting factor-like protein [Trichonephila clavipes]